MAHVILRSRFHTSAFTVFPSTKYQEVVELVDLHHRLAKFTLSLPKGRTSLCTIGRKNGVIGLAWRAGGKCVQVVPEPGIGRTGIFGAVHIGLAAG